MRLKIKRILEYKTSPSDETFENVFGIKLPPTTSSRDFYNFHKNINNHYRAGDVIRLKNISLSNLSDIYMKANIMSITLTQPNDCHTMTEMIEIGNYIEHHWNDLNIQFEVCYNQKYNTLLCNCISISNSKQEFPDDFKKYFTSKFKSADELITNDKFCYGWWD